MNSDILERYVEKVYGYALHHTYSREEADELSQEILYAAVRELPKLKDENKFEPWFWGLASNVTKSYRRSMGKQRARYSYDTLETLTYEEEFSEGQEEVYAALRGKIAMLSATYRDMIVLYYYDDLSVKQISEKLNIPEGTITWRLSEARKKLKKECGTMNESALRPIELTIRISGAGSYNGTTSPFPHVYISDALSQNILYHCYEQPKTVEELAKICGVPAYYVEERLENLLKREAVSESVKGKYRTEFLIYSDKVNEYGAKAKDVFAPVVENMIEATGRLTAEVGKLGVYTAERSEEELKYLYGILALEHLSKKYNPVEQKGCPVRYDGGRWSYQAHMVSNQKYLVAGMGREEGVIYELPDGVECVDVYHHIAYQFGDFTYRKLMSSCQMKVCEELLAGNEITDTEAAALAIEEGYIIRKDGKRKVGIPVFTKAQYRAFTELAEQAFSAVIDAYAEAVRKYLVGYKKLFPKHLEEEVDRACEYMFLTLCATTLYDMAKERGLLAVPPAGSVCDVLVQHREVKK